MRKLYHGGFGGLRVGDYVLPPDETGVASTASYGAAGVCRTDRVYLTTADGAATLIACLHPSGRGKYYEVEPCGDLEDDSDCDLPGLSYACAKARVTKVFQIPRATRVAVIASLMRDPEIAA